MINEIDIKDWEMLATPLPLKELKVNDIFSIEGSNEMFEHYGKLGNSIIAGLISIEHMRVPYNLPDFLKVYKWKKPV